MHIETNNSNGIDMKALRERLERRRQERMEEMRESALAPFATSIDNAEYDFPTKQLVPAGSYISEVKKVSTRMKYDKPILDVCYEITTDDGDLYHIRQSYPLKSVPLKRLHEAMINAGLKAGDSPSKYVGVKEEVVLDYVYENSDFGSIVQRVPYKEVEEGTVKKVAADAVDDWDNDYLEDDYE